jgi:hypothetical protein
MKQLKDTKKQKCDMVENSKNYLKDKKSAKAAAASEKIRAACFKGS